MPSSLKWSDMISEKAATRSLWIYGELLFSKLIRNCLRETHRYLFQERDLRHFEDKMRYYKRAFDALDNFYQQNGINGK